MISFDILGEQDEVPAGTVNDVGASFPVDGFVVVHGVPSATGTIDLGSHNRLEGHKTVPFQLFTFAIYLLAIIEQILDTVHVTMVGQCDRVHVGSDTFIDDILHFRQTV